MKHFTLKMHQISHVSFYTILTRKVRKFFLLKLLYKNSCAKFDVFLRWNGLSIFPQKKFLRSEREIFHYQHSYTTPHSSIPLTPLTLFLINFFVNKI